LRAAHQGLEDFCKPSPFQRHSGCPEDGALFRRLPIAHIYKCSPDIQKALRRINSSGMAQMDAADGSREQYQVEVKSISVVSPDVRLIELGPQSPADLPSFTAGSHIDLALPNGMTRSYSLINPQAERHRYVIAVRRQAEGRGGSRYLHDSLRSGQALAVSAPRNNFPVDESAPASIFIAGGIGITPVWSMIQRLHDIGRPWKLFYGARSRQDAVFADELQAIGRAEQLDFHFGPQPRLSIDSAPPPCFRRLKGRPADVRARPFTWSISPRQRSPRRMANSP
jgi:ferredoxin-NADP reductase